MLSKYHSRTHLQVVGTHQKELEKFTQLGQLVVDGNSLTIAGVVAVSKSVTSISTSLGTLADQVMTCLQIFVQTLSHR